MVKILNKKVKHQGPSHKVKICWYPWKDLVTSNNHVKYQIPSTYCSKDIAKVKVFNKSVKHQVQGHKVKSVGTYGKVLSQETLM
jgi:hypothetical protein